MSDDTIPAAAFTVRVWANPEVPGSEVDAEAARRVIDAALSRAGWADRPPSPSLRLVASGESSTTHETNTTHERR